MNGRDNLIQKKYRFNTDENGFIKPGKIYDDPDLTLAFLGGSTTECIYVNEWNRFPNLVGKVLGRRLNKKVNSYNTGMSGNTTTHSINILLSKLIPLKPDIVIMTHAINDVVTLFYHDTYWNDNPSRSVIVPAYSSKDIHTFIELVKSIKTLLIPNLYKELRKIFVPGATDEFAQVRGKKVRTDKEYVEYITNEFRLNLQTFINICRARGMIPVLATQANRFKDNPDRVVKRRVALVRVEHGLKYKKFKEIYDLFNETVRQVGKENDILVIDLAERIPQESDYIYDSYHFNDEGSILASKIIAEELAKLVENMQN
jgi:lysophospholipase L1-like esterase